MTDFFSFSFIPFARSISIFIGRFYLLVNDNHEDEEDEGAAEAEYEAEGEVGVLPRRRVYNLEQTQNQKLIHNV